MALRGHIDRIRFAHCSNLTIRRDRRAGQGSRARLAVTWNALHALTRLSRYAEAPLTRILNGRVRTIIPTCLRKLYTNADIVRMRETNILSIVQRAELEITGAVNTRPTKHSYQTRYSRLSCHNQVWIAYTQQSKKTNAKIPAGYIIDGGNG